MSPRAFRTMLVGPMGTKDRLELESRVLAAALKQSVELGDNHGVSLAHRQIFLLIRSAHGSGENTGADKSGKKEGQDSQATDESGLTTTGDRPPVVRKRKLPNIVWTEAEEGEDESEIEPADETIEVPYSDEDVIEVIQKSATDTEAEKAASESAETGEADDKNNKTPETKTERALSSTRATKAQPRAHLDEGVFDAYGIIGVEQVASFEKIHVGFLFSIRRLLFKIKKTRRRKRKELLNQLQELWIAHDVLTDPVTRTDYDFRILGLRGAPDVIIDSPDSEGQVMIGSSIPLRIGELLQCAGLLEPTELEIAADMHKAMPEMLFGAFLVKQGFITEPDLEQVLMGQRLLKMGYMSVATFQTCMKHWIDSDTPIYESSVTEGLLTLSEMERIIAQGLRDTDTEIPAIQSSGQVGFRSGARAKVQAIGTGPMLNEEEARKRQVSADHAVPEWKDQLDWSAPPEEEAPKKVRPRKEVKATTESTAYHIEGVTTDRQEGASDRKSLRSLMKGMHMADDADDEQSNDGSGALQMVLEQGNSELENSVETEPVAETTAPESVAPQEVPVPEPAQKETPQAEAPQVETPVNPPSQPEDFTPVESEETLEFEENYDEEDEPIMDFEDSLELPMPSVETETSSSLERVSEQEAESAKTETETFSNLDSVPDNYTGEIEIKLSGEHSSVGGGSTSGDDSSGSEEEETTEEIKQIALTLQKDEARKEAGVEEDSDAQEAARQALKKSIEWQVMYKIKGSLADMLLSDSEEDEIPSLAPKLEDIDVIPKGMSGADEGDSEEDGDNGSN